MDHAENGTVQGLSEGGEEPEEGIFPACPGDMYILTPSFPPSPATETTARVVEFYPCCHVILSCSYFPLCPEGPPLPLIRADV